MVLSTCYFNYNYRRAGMKSIIYYAHSILYIIEGYIRKCYARFSEKKTFVDQKVSIISNNCVGGIIYHDFDLQFLSPTINCYFMANDYIKFLKNIDYYLVKEIQAIKNEKDGTVIGVLDDLCIYFVHDHNPLKVSSEWNRRKKRVDLNNIFVIASDRDGWTEEHMTIYSNFTFPKCFFTSHKEWSEYPFSIYYPEYSNLGSIPNLISCRKIYSRHKIFKLISQRTK
jgi:uncharacterized protein (DUF1919 family)